MEMDDGHPKRYSDASVQTSPVLSATRSHDSNAANTTPIPSRLKRVTYIDQTSSDICYDESRSRRVYPRTPISRTKAQLPLDLPNQTPDPSATLEQRRVVSLPEQIGPALLSQKLANSLTACSRNVSMPAVVQHFPQTDWSYEDLPSMHVSPSVSSEERSGPRDFAQSSEFLCTPSFDSSSSSIEIINGSLHFPETFLQAHASQARAKSNDWLSWNSSPPRPIPALHGPSSLPYARCPSGAEGTIIEQQSSVPGLIWGLRGSNAAAEIQCTSASAAINERSEGRKRVSGSEDSRSLEEQPLAKPTRDLQQFIVDHYTSSSQRLPSECTVRGEISSSDPRELAIRSNTETEALDSSNRSKNNPQPDDHNATDSGSTRKHGGRACVTLPDLHSSGILPHIAQDDAIRHASVYSATRWNETLAQEIYAQSDMACNLSDRRTKTTSQRPGIHEGHTDTCSLRRQCTCYQDMPLTPPDSASPLWSSQFPPVTTDQSSASQRQLQDGVIRPSTSQFSGLNLRHSEEGSESLSDQLKKLIIHDQSSPERRRGHSPYPTHDRSSAPQLCRNLPTVPPPRPEMPINLHELVTRHVRGQSQADAESGARVSAVNIMPLPDSASASLSGCPAPADVKSPSLPSSEACNGNREARGGVLPGIRYPRSIPLTRLLERKLAPVPEETSFSSTGTESSAPKTRVSLPPISTSGKTKKDYDFAELRSPLEETAADEKFASQQEAPNQIDERRVLQPAKQRKRQPKQKAPADAKPNHARTKEHKNERNDENIHVVEPKPSTPKKKSKTAKHNTTSKRAFGSQRSRRTN